MHSHSHWRQLFGAGNGWFFFVVVMLIVFVVVVVVVVDDVEAQHSREVEDGFSLFS